MIFNDFVLNKLSFLVRYKWGGLRSEIKKENSIIRDVFHFFRSVFLLYIININSKILILCNF